MAKYIAIEKIHVPERLREVSEAHVDLLANNINQNGLLSPILVMIKSKDEPENYILVAGAHRLAAVKKLNQPTINCEIRNPANIEQVRLWEIDENLFRNELNAFERGKFLSERRDIWQQLNGYDHLKTEKGMEQIDMFSGFDADTRNLTGLSSRSIRRDIAMFKNIGIRAGEIVAAHPEIFTHGALAKLAKHAADKDIQTNLAKLMVQDPTTYKTPDIALAFLKDPEGFSKQKRRDSRMGHRQKTFKKQLNALCAAWSVANPDVRAEFLTWANLIEVEADDSK